MEQITIQNVGPIHNLTIPVPERGGVVVLEGDNGVGKSEALRAVGSLIDGEGGLEPREGTVSGEVDGLGCRIRVGRKTTRGGELVVKRLEGGDPSVFVEPGIQDPERADAARVRELIRLARVEISESAWEEVAGGADVLASIARPKTVAEKDPVERAKLLKADFEREALRAESESDNWTGRMMAMLEAIKGIDLSAPCEASAIRAEEDAAARAQVELETRKKGAVAAQSAAEKASSELAAARAAYQGPSVQGAEVAVQEAEGDVAASEGEVREAELALERARGVKRAAVTALEQRKSELRSAREHVAAIAGWESSIEAARNARPAPGDDELAAAAARVSAARDAAEVGVRVRDALAKKTKAEEASEQAAAFKVRGERMRERARACEGVLTEAISRVAPRGLRFVGGRLVLDADGREKFFGELSDGERWQIGFDIAVDAAGEGAVIPIRQSAWQDLDPTAKRERALHAQERGVVVLTAECTRGGELRASVYEPAAVAS